MWVQTIFKLHFGVMSVYLNNKKDLFPLEAYHIFSKSFFFSFFLRVYLIFCVLSVLPAFMYVHHIHALCLWRSEESVKCPGTGVTDGMSVCWELNPSPLQL